MTRRLVAVPALLVAAALVAGCSGTEDRPETVPPAATTTASPDDTTATSAAPTGPPRDDPGTPEETGTADVVTGDSGAFRVRLPEGWVDARGQVEQEVELAIRSATLEDDFYPNVVVAQEAPIEDLDSSLRRAAQDISGAEDAYELLDPVDVAGRPAPGYTFQRTTGDMEISQTQRWVQHDGHLYIVTLSVAASWAEEGAQVLGELLRSWEWAG